MPIYCPLLSSLNTFYHQTQSVHVETHTYSHVIPEKDEVA